MNMQAEPIFVLEVNNTIALLNIVCIMNRPQFSKVFPKREQQTKLMNFLYNILNI